MQGVIKMETTQQNADEILHGMQDAPVLGGQQMPPCAGIVAEYNPFHKGHGWMIQQLKRGGVETVVCVMSGPFVQRAQPGILPTHVRARAALAAGADLVLRLPAQWAAASAEAFAAGGAGLLAALGCVDMLAFGAETPELASLETTAALLLSPQFNAALKAQLATGVSFAAARAAAAESLAAGTGEIINSPNNILGVEYIKALLGAVPEALRQKMPEELHGRVVAGLFGKTADMSHLFMLPVPVAMPRAGAQHDGAPQAGFASASWLRQQAAHGGVGAWASWVPPECMPIYLEAEAKGELISDERWELALLSRLRAMGTEQLAQFPGAGEGLNARLAAAAKRATSLEELYSEAKSKRFAHSRVRRLAVSAALGLPQSSPVVPPFAHVLAANGRGLALLRRAKQMSLIPVSTSLAKLARAGGQAQQTAEIEAAAEDLFSLCMQTPQAGGQAYTRPAVMQAANTADFKDAKNQKRM